MNQRTGKKASITDYDRHCGIIPLARNRTLVCATEQRICQNGSIILYGDADTNLISELGIERSTPQYGDDLIEMSTVAKGNMIPRNFSPRFVNCGEFNLTTNQFDRFVRVTIERIDMKYRTSLVKNEIQFYERIVERCALELYWQKKI